MKIKNEVNDYELEAVET